MALRIALGVVLALLVLGWSMEVNAGWISRECRVPTCDNVDIALDVAALIAGPVAAVAMGSLVLGRTGLRGTAPIVIGTVIAIANGAWMIVDGWPPPEDSPQRGEAILGLVMFAAIVLPCVIVGAAASIRWLAARGHQRDAQA